MSRCVHCGQPKESHVPETLVCRLWTVHAVYSTMELPAGRTCGDCAHFKRTCEWLIDCKADRTTCDWWPVRFVAISSTVGSSGIENPDACSFKKKGE